jgi:hypothetical protein
MNGRSENSALLPLLRKARAMTNAEPDLQLILKHWSEIMANRILVLQKELEALGIGTCYPIPKTEADIGFEIQQMRVVLTWIPSKGSMYQSALERAAMTISGCELLLRLRPLIIDFTKDLENKLDEAKKKHVALISEIQREYELDLREPALTGEL